MFYMPVVCPYVIARIKGRKIPRERRATQPRGLTMRFMLRAFVLAAASSGLWGCGAAGAQEPTEAEMKAAMLYEMNHPPGTVIPAPITITYFKKQACDKPTPQGFNCTFNVEVASSDSMAGFYANLPGANFYKDDKGKWQMRPPF